MNMKKFFENLIGNSNLVVFLNLCVGLIICLILVFSILKPAGKLLQPQIVFDVNKVIDRNEQLIKENTLALFQISLQRDTLKAAEDNIKELQKANEVMSRQIDQGNNYVNENSILKGRVRDLSADNERLEKDNVYLQALLKRRKK